MKFRDQFCQLTPGCEGYREERGIATVRAFLAVTALVAISIEPTEPRSYAAVAYLLLAAYAIFSTGTLLWLRLASRVPRRVPLLFHTVDLCLATAITMLTDGPDSPFFVLFLFAPVAAAYRFGFGAALTTTAALTGVLAAEAVLVGSTNRLSMSIVAGTFALNRFVMRAAYLAIAGVVFAYLIEKEKERRTEASAVARIVGEADERKRLACELHDGIIQSLSAAEMQLAVARRQVPDEASDLDEQLARVQTLLLQEAANLRALMEGMRSGASAVRTQGDLAAIVERFQDETGIDARFVSDEPKVPLSERAGYEVVRIVQEGLVNVRKHSGARHVLVSATADTTHLNLSIEDDGRGFAFSGRLSQAELDARNEGPVTIRERVRALGGEMSVESTPGAGTRLALIFPL
jgi:signal transduction histidine kinase